MILLSTFSLAMLCFRVAWEMQTHDGPAPVILVLVSGMGHQIAGGNDNGLPHQRIKDAPDTINMALQFFVDHPLP